MRKVLNSGVVLLASLLAAGVYAEEQMAFVFELVRHGARAPLDDSVKDFFKVTTGQLTAEGMRQRYLLGQSNRKRYTEEYEFLTPDYVPSEIYMQSTDVNRTMQSGYSELMGLYPPGESGAPQLSAGMQASLNEFGRGMPIFEVRDKAAINKNLGFNALPEGFTAVPITTFNNNDILDDASYDGCDYINEVDDARWYDDSTHSDYEYICDDIRQPVQDALQLSDHDAAIADLHLMYDYCDTIRSLRFEGVDMEWTFTEKTWLECLETQSVMLTRWFTGDTRALLNSRILRKPLHVMQRKVDNLLGRNAEITDNDGNEPEGFFGVKEDELKLQIYSGHDDQIDNHLYWLNPTNYELLFVPFASQITYELKYDDTCVAFAARDESCFTVGVRYNGQELAFSGCNQGVDEYGCSYNDFVAYIDSIWYSGVDSDDLNAACFQEYTPSVAALFLQ